MAVSLRAGDRGKCMPIAVSSRAAPVQPPPRKQRSGVEALILCWRLASRRESGAKGGAGADAIAPTHRRRQLSTDPSCPLSRAICASSAMARVQQRRAMSAEVIDLTGHDDDAAHGAAPGRPAKRARRAHAHIATATAEVIDLSRDEEAAAPAGGSGGGAALSGVLAPFSCAVCFCDYGPEEGHALFCGHVFCRDCLGAHCKTQVADGLPDAAGIFCPEPRCRAPLTGADVSAVADAATAARFEELALEKLIQSNSDSLGCALSCASNDATEPSRVVTLSERCAGAARRRGARSCSRGTLPTASCSVRSATTPTASCARRDAAA